MFSFAFKATSASISIATYLPREGPETHKRTCTPHQSSDLYISQYTSVRGRKRVFLGSSSTIRIDQYSYLSTSRGAGNLLV